MAMPDMPSRWSSLSVRLALLIAGLLALSALVTTAYSAITAHRAASASSEQAMQKALESTTLLVHQSNDQARGTGGIERLRHLDGAADQGGHYIAGDG